MVIRVIKNVLKGFILGLAWLHAHIYILMFKLLKVNFKAVAIGISRFEGNYGILVRKIFYKKTLESCGENLRVHYGAYIVYPEVEIGDRCTIEEFTIIGNCKIGNNVIFAARVSVMSGSRHHDVDDLNNLFYESKSFSKTLIIGDNIWFGTHAVIMEDVAAHNVIAAGAVVTKKFESYNVIGGVPAKVIRKRGKR
jgi:acetyltransferase-like isoleucine patch superfamily enzyme